MQRFTLDPTEETPFGWTTHIATVADVPSNAVRVASSGLGQGSPLRFDGKIREIFSAREHHRMVIDCPGFQLVGSVERAPGQFCGLSEGVAVTVSLKPSAIHVI